jgi:putative nucleotidyltransferase with HDIG domain
MPAEMENLPQTDKKHVDAISKDKFARLAELPSLPALLMEALQQLNDAPDVTILADKIGQDPPLVARILRIANSPFYGMSREIGSMREAIVLLGMNRVRDMLFGVCFSKMLPLRHKDFDYALFWHHSMAVADCTRQLADCTGISPEFAFTTGLLHDIGRLIIVVLFPDAFSRILNESDQHLAVTERRVLGFDHMEMGGKAARYWNFPVAIQEAIELHETPPVRDSTKSLALLVYAANLLIAETKQGNESSVEEQEAIRLALDIVDIPIDQAALFVKSARQFADQIVAIL